MREKFRSFQRRSPYLSAFAFFLTLIVSFQPSYGKSNTLKVFTAKDWLKIESKFNVELVSNAPTMPWYPIRFSADTKNEIKNIIEYYGILVTETLYSNKKFQEFSLHVSHSNTDLVSKTSDKGKDLTLISDISESCKVYYIGKLSRGKFTDDLLISDAAILNSFQDNDKYKSCLWKAITKLFGREEPAFLTGNADVNLFEKEVISINMSRYCRYTNRNPNDCLRKFKNN